MIEEPLGNEQILTDLGEVPKPINQVKHIDKETHGNLLPDPEANMPGFYGQPLKKDVEKIKKLLGRE